RTRGGSAQETIFLTERLGGVFERRLGRRAFAENADLAEKLADLRVVARAHRCVGLRRIADIDAEMLHRRLHHRRQTVGGALAGKEREATLPVSRLLQVPGAESADHLCADARA